MRHAFIFIAVVLISCKKENNAATTSLRETHWNLFYKNNNTFTFFAQSEIYFKSNDSAENDRNFDTIRGSWSQSNASVNIHFNNGDAYTGKVITSDSIS